MGSNFPNGVVGTAYLLIRVQAAMIVLRFALLAEPGSPWCRAVLCIAIASLALGLFARPTAAICTILLLVDFAFHAPDIAVAGQAIAMTAAALLGAGAYSIDALRFGRREIRFRP